MTLAIIVAFLVLFLVVVGSATLGMRFYDQRRKKQVTDMLKSVSGDQADIPTGQLLMAAEEGQHTGIERVFSELDVTKKLEVLITQAGLDWTPGRFYIMSLMCAAVKAS